MFVRVTKARELSGLSRKEWAQLLSDGLLAIYRPLPGTALVKLKDLRRALETNRWPAANPADKKGSRRRPRPTRRGRGGGPGRRLGRAHRPENAAVREG